MFIRAGHPNVFVICENLNDPNSDESNALKSKIRQAGETQRGEPESVMLDVCRIIQAANGPNTLVHAIEHTGDLAHRAQSMNSITNVNEKVSMMLQYWSPQRWSLEKEITDGIINNCAYRYLKNQNLYDEVMKLPSEQRYLKWEEYKQHPEVLKLIAHAHAETNRALKLYVAAHKQHNLPITKLGRLGKNAAIALGEQNFIELHRILKEMDKWLKKYSSSNQVDRWNMFREN
jgi:hypothetical protein